MTGANNYPTWISLFDEQETLLKRLMQQLDAEKKAILDNDTKIINTILPAKAAALRELESAQARLAEFKRSATKTAGKPRASWQELIDTFEPAERKTLSEKRRTLMWHSRRVQRANDFNSRCLNSYLEHTHLISSLLGLAGPGSGTYTAEGQSASARGHGRLVNRSY